MSEPVATVVGVTFDPAAIAWLAELRQPLSRLSELVEKPVDLVQLIDRARRCAPAVVAEPRPAGGAAEHRVVLEFGQPWLDLMAALRAVQGMGDLVGETGHAGSPSVVGTSMVNESPSAREAGGGSAPPHLIISAPST